MIYLARVCDQGPVLIADLALEENIPKKFLEAILFALKNNSVLQGKKGQGGGYYLARHPKIITSVRPSGLWMARSHRSLGSVKLHMPSVPSVQTSSSAASGLL